jgi:hypothetical protein
LQIASAEAIHGAGVGNGTIIINAVVTEFLMKFPVKVCVVCSEEFELKPGKPGFANRCPSCSESEASEPGKQRMDADERKSNSEANAARREAMKNLLYRKDS